MVQPPASRQVVHATGALSAAARQRMLSRKGEPLFLAAWENALMIHLEVDANELQRAVPFELDLWNGRAFVSLVAFTMRDMRPRRGGKVGEWLFRPIATHNFLNVRTYVRHNGEPGIHFLAEWLSSRLAVKLGPTIFSLPYRFGHIVYDHDWKMDSLHGIVTDSTTGSQLHYEANKRFDTQNAFTPCEIGSLDEWLMERYTAFNSAGGRKRFFRVWHPPWPQIPMDVIIHDDSLLTQHWPWFNEARLAGANFSPGFREVWMGRPHRIH